MGDLVKARDLKPGMRIDDRNEIGMSLLFGPDADVSVALNQTGTVGGLT